MRMVKVLDVTFKSYDRLCHHLLASLASRHMSWLRLVLIGTAHTAKPAYDCKIAKALVKSGIIAERG